MMPRNLRMVVAFIALCFVCATPAVDAERFVALGNAAFERGDFESALDLYSRAEERINDPGLVAFNKAASLYRLRQFRDAELHYLRCLEAANGERKIRALYNLGNAVVRQAEDRDAKRLEQAIAYYEQALTTGADGELRENVHHNLVLARQFLAAARSGKRPSSRDDERATNNDHPSSNDRRMPDPMKPEHDQSQTTPVGAQGRTDGAVSGTVSTAQAPPPGVGNLPVIPDEDALRSMSSEDAKRHLEQAVARVLRERVEHRRGQTQAPPSNVRNW